MRISNKQLGAAMLALIVAAGLNTPAFAQPGGIEFGDDSSTWANDGECDDPRFGGLGMADELEDIDIARDATDCRTLFEAGQITFLVTPPTTPPTTPVPPTEIAPPVSPPLAPPVTPATPVVSGDIDFGDDSSDWANDGECDDMRFAGEGMAFELVGDDVGRDATDCRTLFEAGQITLAPPDEGDGNSVDDIDFGDDTSEWANDQECDDPRFSGAGMASELDKVNIGRDATDCRNAFIDGTVTLADEQLADDDGGQSTVPNTVLAALAARIDFGDDSSEWANDGECDDPDFFGPGVVPESSDINRLRDASDCRAAFIEGTASLKSAASLATSFDYGDDSSEWANDGQCDDLRFTGPGMAKKLSEEDVRADATDCRTLEEQGEVTLKPVYDPAYVLGAPYDSSSVDFGDNSSSYADDGICDDPRFEGPGVATTLLDGDRLADAADCRAAFEKGTIILR